MDEHGERQSQGFSTRGKDRNLSKGRITKEKLLGYGAAIALVSQIIFRGAKADYSAVKAKEEVITGAIGDLFQGEESPGEVAGILIGKDSTYFNLVYPGLSDKDLEIAKEQAIEAGQLSLDFGRISRTAKYEGQIREIAREQGVPEELFLGFVMYESEGWPNSVGPVGEKGFTQMTAAMAQRYDLQTSEGESDERFDPGKILPASAKELKGYYDKFGNWGLAFQAWNVGEPQLYGLLKTYFENSYGEYLPSIDETLESEVPGVIQLYKDKIEEHGVTVYQLFNDSQVQIVIVGSGWAGTDKYDSRILGSYAVYEAFKTIVAS